MHHQAWASPIGRRSRDQSRNALQRIADTLRVPIQTLCDAADAEHYPDDTAELVRLWFKIEDEAKRREIVGMVRRVAGEG